MIEIVYNKPVVNYEKLDEVLKAQTYGASVSYIGSKNINTVSIFFNAALTASEQLLCDDIVNNFIDFTTAESLAIYLDETVFPFIDGLINRFASENIALGITQAGQTGAVLGLFEKKYDVHSNNLPISLKGSLDTGSLYESINILNFLIVNPSQYTGMSPYVTSVRLQSMVDEITEFLL